MGEVILHRPVPVEDDGERADVVLARWLGEPRTRAQSRLDAGEVTVGGEVPVKSRRLRAGEQVTVLAPPPAAAYQSPPVPIRYEDEHLVVVAKPAGMVVHPGAGTTGGTPMLVSSLQEMGIALAPGLDPLRPGIVHRLDRGTSGLLIIAKTEEARAPLAEAFRIHAVEREYWVLADGVPRMPRATIDAPIMRSKTHRTRFRVDPDGRAARTHYDVEAALGRASVLAVRLETGRTHQVRVHLASVGHPVTGDIAYGASATLKEELGLERPALHARHLGFRHPVTGTAMAFNEPLPPDLLQARQRLEVTG